MANWLIKDKRKKLCMLFILLIVIVNALYWCGAKEGYYIDELWTYGLSNSYYMPFLQQQEGYMNEWHQPSFYMDYLSVNQDETFAYASVYSNQVSDVHPPSHYMLLHTVCSLFPEHFSKWFGLIINLFFFCLSVILLYKISGLIFGEGSYSSLIPPLLYGFSIGAVATLIYIRMYMMLTFWTLLFTFTIFRLMRESDAKYRRSRLIGVSLSIAGGFLTQYYFVIFVFFFSLGYMAWNIITRKWRRIWEFLIAAGAGAVCSILIFPACLRHIFMGYQGKQAFANASNDIHLFVQRLAEYLDAIVREVWGVHMGLKLILIVFLALIIIGIWIFKKIRDLENQGFRIWLIVPKTECIMLFIAITGYFSVIAQISPEVADRYQFIIYPFCVLLPVSAMVYLLKKLQKESLIWIAALCGILLMVHAYASEPVPYVYKGYKEAVCKIETEYKNAPGIYVTTGDHLVINNCIFLAKQDMTYPLTLEQISEIDTICRDIDTEHMVLYVDIYYDEYKTAELVKELMGYSSCSLLYDNTFTQIYVLSR